MKKVGEEHWSFVHGGATKDKISSEYQAFTNAKSRCTNPKNPGYPYYGGRGIEFRFNSFVEFINEIGYKPSKECSLDRIDANGHYEKRNVRWAKNQFEQQNNQRRTIRFTVDGKTRTVGEWSRLSGIPRNCIRNRVYLSKWCAKCAVTIPINAGTCHHRR